MYQVIEGQYVIEGVKYKRHALPGTFPRRYWDLIEIEREPAPPLYTPDRLLIRQRCGTCKRSFRMYEETYRRLFPYINCYRCHLRLKAEKELRRANTLVEMGGLPVLHTTYESYVEMLDWMEENRAYLELSVDDATGKLEKKAGYKAA